MSKVTPLISLLASQTFNQYNTILENQRLLSHFETFTYIRTQKLSYKCKGQVCETQTCRHSRVVIYINPCINEGTLYQELIFRCSRQDNPNMRQYWKRKGIFYIMGNREYKVQLKKSTNKQVPHNHYWTMHPKLSLFMYNVYANIDFFGFDRCFFFFLRHFCCSHGLHVLENLCFTVVAKVGMRTHHDIFRRLMRA